MNEERQERLRGHIGRGMLLSFLIHGSQLVPFVALAIVFARREVENRDLDVRFEEVAESELPTDLPPLPPEPGARPDSPKRPILAEREPEPEIRVPPEEELPPLPEPKPEEEKKPEEPPRPVPERRPNQKMVDLDMGQEVEPPPDAKYLAQKNNRAEVETRATDTNLERAQQGGQASSRSDRQDEQAGDQDRKIAELEDQASRKGKSAPRVVPHTDPELAAGAAEKRRSLLSMRDAERRAHEVTPETADPSLPRDPDGVRPLPLEQRPRAVGDLGRPGGPARPRLSITGEQYRYLFGDDAEAAERLAQKERSRRPGRFAERLERMQSALENFIPEVRPGNQTALNTRAAPFAAYIARMHRSIHKLWGFGFLEDLERKPSSSPFNDPHLVSRLELVLNPDGTVHKVTVVKTSGFLPFDVAAIDVVYSAAPYPDPPREIRSGNGKIYIHWTFHRDERQCATSGVDYYILDNAPAGGDKGEPEAERGLPTPRPAGGLKRLPREIPDTPAHRAKMRELDQTIERAGGSAREEPEPEAARRAAQQVVRADDPAARAVAEDWLSAFTRGDVARMLRHAVFPFRSATGVAAKSAAELRPLFEGLLEETPAPRRVRSLQLHSAAGARGALGGLPPGIDDGQGLLFATARIGDDTLILVLGQHGETWRLVALVRR